MATLLRHLLAITALPFLVAIVIPTLLARQFNLTLTFGSTLLHYFAQLIGMVFLLCGLIFFVSSLYRFATEGQGTLAPWDPPQKLVVSGFYRYARNPMISGVFFILVAEALLLLSIAHLGWALLFFMINSVYILKVEEPQLARRFGDSYLEYCKNVPRLLPSLQPWEPSVGGRDAHPTS